MAPKRLTVEQLLKELDVTAEQIRDAIEQTASNEARIHDESLRNHKHFRDSYARLHRVLEAAVEKIGLTPLDPNPKPPVCVTDDAGNSITFENYSPEAMQRDLEKYDPSVLTIAGSAHGSLLRCLWQLEELKREYDEGGARHPRRSTAYDKQIAAFIVHRLLRAQRIAPIFYYGALLLHDLNYIDGRRPESSSTEDPAVDQFRKSLEVAQSIDAVDPIQITSSELLIVTRSERKK